MLKISTGCANFSTQGLKEAPIMTRLKSVHEAIAQLLWQNFNS